MKMLENIPGTPSKYNQEIIDKLFSVRGTKPSKDIAMNTPVLYEWCVKLLNNRR